MKVLMTGWAGYLGRGLFEAFADHHELRLLDVIGGEHGGHQQIVGSVEDFDVVMEAMEGVDAAVIGHMASRQPGTYDTPERPFDINVKGTANVYEAAARVGARRMALVSSLGVVMTHKRAGAFLRRDLPFGTRGIYGLTKRCQEMIAQQYHEEHGIGTAILRPSYIQDADTMADKYGRVSTEVNWNYIDRRDIGLAARLAVELPDLGCEVFYTLGHPSAEAHADVAYTRQRLGWQPQHPFTHLPEAPPEPG